MFTSLHVNKWWTITSRKNVAIRGLDFDLYKEIFSIAKSEGKRVSDIMNQALQEYIKGSNGDNLKKSVNDFNEKFILRNNGEISLSKNDIISLKKEVGSFVIENNGHIIFEKDVDNETLSYIDSIIIRDGQIEVPKNMYYQFLIKSEINGKLQKY